MRMVWTVTFLGAALLCGLFAYGEITTVEAPGSDMLFILFLILAAVALISEYTRDRD